MLDNDPKEASQGKNVWPIIDFFGQISIFLAHYLFFSARIGNFRPDIDFFGHFFRGSKLQEF